MMTKYEYEVIRQCLIAMVDGDFVPDWEFSTVCSTSKNEMARIADQWDYIDKDAECVKDAINDAMLNLIGYPHRKEAKVEKFTSVSLKEVKRIYESWLQIQVGD